MIAEKCKGLMIELEDAREIIRSFERESKAAHLDGIFIDKKLTDLEGLCDVLLLIDDSRVRTLAGLQKNIIINIKKSLNRRQPIREGQCQKT